MKFNKLNPQPIHLAATWGEPKPAFAEEEVKYGQTEEILRAKEEAVAAEEVYLKIGLNTISGSLWRTLWDSRKQYPEGWSLDELVECTDFSRASTSGALQRLRRAGYARNVDRRWTAKL